MKLNKGAYIEMPPLFFPGCPDQVDKLRAIHDFRNAELTNTLNEIYLQRRIPAYRTLSRPAYIGKVTPKPGVIKDGSGYRWKTLSDYKLWERIVIWFCT